MHFRPRYCINTLGYLLHVPDLVSVSGRNTLNYRKRCLFFQILLNSQASGRPDLAQYDKGQKPNWSPEEVVDLEDSDPSIGITVLAGSGEDETSYREVFFVFSLKGGTYGMENYEDLRIAGYIPRTSAMIQR
jgi:hypothetical protein